MQLRLKSESGLHETGHLLSVFFCTAKEGGGPPSRARARTGFLSGVRNRSTMRPACVSFSVFSLSLSLSPSLSTRWGSPGGPTPRSRGSWVSLVPLHLFVGRGTPLSFSLSLSLSLSLSTRLEGRGESSPLPSHAYAHLQVLAGF